eukprot:gnl/Chilomastix_cuspidata/1545.p1 GENE.gnl/Chilomastix_cuspidata/1545~~gnl/Chilomastix_cuspidata/1545.p1  ORF type:complete len:1373 (-),score=469.50 gnl/Chilomastix_cuspidata/1545:774-4856(-)
MPSQNLKGNQKMSSSKIFMWKIKNFNTIPIRYYSPSFKGHGGLYRLYIQGFSHLCLDVVPSDEEYQAQKTAADQDPNSVAAAWARRVHVEFTVWKVARGRGARERCEFSQVHTTRQVTLNFHPKARFYRVANAFGKISQKEYLAGQNHTGVLHKNTVCVSVAVKEAKKSGKKRQGSKTTRDAYGFVGLQNQGATCYLNSLIQTLFHINALRRLVFRIPTDADSSPLVYELQRLFFGMQTSQEAASTGALTRSFGWVGAEAFVQHDIGELHQLLFERLEERLSTLPDPEAEGRFLSERFRELFTFHLTNYVECLNYEYASYRPEKALVLNLPVKGCKNLYDCFDKFYEPSELTGSDGYRVEGVGLKDAHIGTSVEAFPPVLFLQLRRFDFDLQLCQFVKVTDPIEFPPILNLSKYVRPRRGAGGDEEDEGARAPRLPPSHYSNYVLLSVLVHRGGLRGGHYFSFIAPRAEVPPPLPSLDEKDLTRAERATRSSSLAPSWINVGKKAPSKFIQFNDARVSFSKQEQVYKENFGSADPRSSQTAYMLVYVNAHEVSKVCPLICSEDLPATLVHELLALEGTRTAPSDVKEAPDKKESTRDTNPNEEVEDIPDEPAAAPARHDAAITSVVPSMIRYRLTGPGFSVPRSLSLSVPINPEKSLTNELEKVNAAVLDHSLAELVDGDGVPDFVHMKFQKRENLTRRPTSSLSNNDYHQPLSQSFLFTERPRGRLFSFSPQIEHSLCGLRCNPQTPSVRVLVKGYFPDIPAHGLEAPLSDSMFDTTPSAARLLKRRIVFLGAVMLPKTQKIKAHEKAFKNMLSEGYRRLLDAGAEGTPDFTGCSVRIYEEIRNDRVDVVSPEHIPKKAHLRDGDILIVQLTHAEAMEEFEREERAARLLMKEHYSLQPKHLPFECPNLLAQCEAIVADDEREDAAALPPPLSAVGAYCVLASYSNVTVYSTSLDKMFSPLSAVRTNAGYLSSNEIPPREDGTVPKFLTERFAFPKSCTVSTLLQHAATHLGFEPAEPCALVFDPPAPDPEFTYDAPVILFDDDFAPLNPWRAAHKAEREAGSNLVPLRLGEITNPLLGSLSFVIRKLIVPPAILTTARTVRVVFHARTEPLPVRDLVCLVPKKPELATVAVLARCVRQRTSACFGPEDMLLLTAVEFGRVSALALEGRDDTMPLSELYRGAEYVRADVVPAADVPALCLVHHWAPNDTNPTIGEFSGSPLPLPLGGATTAAQLLAAATARYRAALETRAADSQRFEEFAPSPFSIHERKYASMPVPDPDAILSWQVVVTSADGALVCPLELDETILPLLGPGLGRYVIALSHSHDAATNTPPDGLSPQQMQAPRRGFGRHAPGALKIN